MLPEQKATEVDTDHQDKATAAVVLHSLLHLGDKLDRDKRPRS